MYKIISNHHDAKLILANVTIFIPQHQSLRDYGTLIYRFTVVYFVLKIVKGKSLKWLFSILKVLFLIIHAWKPQETMNRYFIKLSFKGTHYHGWQFQLNAVTVQSLVEQSLRILSQTNIKTTGAGRTDTGVHARSFVAHFDSDCKLFENKPDFLYKINALLPPEIAIHDVYRVVPNGHSRYSAISRTYEYIINRIKDPFDTDLSWQYSVPLNLEAMNQSAGMLKNHTDFTSFSKLHSSTKTNVCHIEEALWVIQGTKLIFRIRADRFLRNMVRALVGTLVEVGRGKLSQSDFIAIIEGRNRNLAGFSAPAEGLSLISIEYPQNIKA